MFDLDLQPDVLSVLQQLPPEAKRQTSMATAGRCLFIMPTDGDFSAIDRAIKS